MTDDRSVAAAVQLAEHTAGHLDVIVNNAGYVASGLDETLTSEQVLAELDTNVVDAHRVNRAALPTLRRDRHFDGDWRRRRARARLKPMVDSMHDGPGASDPEEVARAVVALVEAPAGTRALRVVVDPTPRR